MNSRRGETRDVVSEIETRQRHNRIMIIVAVDFRSFVDLLAVKFERFVCVTFGISRAA